MKNKIIYNLFALLATITISYAQPPQGQEEKKQPTIEELFKKMDTNKDGKLSKKEVKGPLKDDFAKIDLDKDGFITKKELKKAPKPKGRKPESKK